MFKNNDNLRKKRTDLDSGDTDADLEDLYGWIGENNTPGETIEIVNLYFILLPKSSLPGAEFINQAEPYQRSNYNNNIAKRYIQVTHGISDKMLGSNNVLLSTNI